MFNSKGCHDGETVFQGYRDELTLALDSLGMRHSQSFAFIAKFFPFLCKQLTTQNRVEREIEQRYKYLPNSGYDCACQNATETLREVSIIPDLLQTPA
jgi:hypothetical protein